MIPASKCQSEFTMCPSKPPPKTSMPLMPGQGQNQNGTVRMNAEEVIKILGLAPHPEGGWYKQTWVADAPEGKRPSGTCIYFLLPAGERSHWHRVDATEIWLYHAGAPLILSLSATDEGPAQDYVLGPDLMSAAPQIIVPENHWQAARSQGDWTLVSCTVSPGFQFDGFTLAEDGFDIPRSSQN